MLPRCRLGESVSVAPDALNTSTLVSTDGTQSLLPTEASSKSIEREAQKTASAALKDATLCHNSLHSGDIRDIIECLKSLVNVFNKTLTFN